MITFDLLSPLNAPHNEWTLKYLKLPPSIRMVDIIARVEWSLPLQRRAPRRLPAGRANQFGLSETTFQELAVVLKSRKVRFLLKVQYI